MIRRLATGWALCSLVLLAVTGPFAGPAHALETKAAHAILVDTTTGAVLFEKKADEPMPPASMSKIMTVYMVFERLKDGRLSLDDTFPVSEKAWRKGGSKMFVKVDERVRVEDLLRGIIVQSGNDACIVIAEGLSGSEEQFAQEMTERARELGLEISTFKNATGWPAEGHVMTARELAKLAQLTIENFPEYYGYYSETEFTYNGIRQTNRNPLLYKNMGADGLKTGHTSESGYGLTASVVRNGRRLILVMNGLTSVRERSREAERLIEWGFRETGNYPLFAAGETVTEATVWLGSKGVVPLILDEDLIVTLPRRARKEMKVAAVFDGPIPAPIRKGDVVATLRITAPGIDPIERPLKAGADIGRLGLFGRIGAALRYVVWGDAN